jgi:hypothetical protein
LIVAEIDDQQYCMVTQGDHAAFAADLLAVWPALAGIPRDSPAAQTRRDLVLRATRLHDNGWAELDSAPPVAGNGRPHDFLTLPTPARRELWQRGVARYADSDPGVAALILRHAIYVLGLSHDTPPEDLARLQDQLETLHQSLGWSEEQAETLYQWLQLADALSLQVCARWTRPTQHFVPEFPVPVRTPSHRAPLSAITRPGELTLSPFPLAGSTTLQLSCRLIARRPYGSSTELALALAEAAWQRLPCKVRPPAPG